MLLGASGVTWRQLTTDPTLATGIGVVALTGLVGAVRHVFALAEGRAGDAAVKQAFAIPDDPVGPRADRRLQRSGSSSVASACT